MLRLAVVFAPLLLLMLACCFGASPTATVQARGTVRDIHGAPMAGARIVLIANDSASCPDCTGTGTEVATTSAADGTFSLTNASFNPGGYEGLVEVRSADDLVAATYHFPAPGYTGPTTVEVTFYLDDRTDPGPLASDHTTFERDEAAAAFVLCTPRPLHACTGQRGEGSSERRWIAFDIDATASCETLVADARTRCGAGTDETTFACLEHAGLFLDARALPIVPAPDPAAGGMSVRCDEGHADPPND